MVGNDRIGLLSRGLWVRSPPRLPSGRINRLREFPSSALSKYDAGPAPMVCFVNDPSSACPLKTLQAHLVLESISAFRLILYWKRVSLAEYHSYC